MVSRLLVAGMLLVVVLVAGGRLIRHHLMLGGDGQWRRPGFLEARLPPLAAVEVDDAPPDTLDYLLNVNLAPADSLVLLPGVGPVLAARIVAERETGGRFATLGDLQRVKGIGARSAAKIGLGIRFEAVPADSTTNKIRPLGS